MGFELLAGISEQEATEVLSQFRRRKFSRGEVVFHEGDPADTLHLVARGLFGVEKILPLGDTSLLAVLGPGAFFGELALLSADAHRTATVAAIEDSETRSIHRDDLERIRRAHPSVTEALIRALVAQVDRLSHRLSESLYVSADERVVRRLRELGAMFERPGEETLIPLTQEQLAAIAGTSRATTNRVLRDLERAGTLRLQRRGTVVTDSDALAKARPRARR
jgi:CRP-like cAMP-binding protein